ncbi:MAG: tripartite tricarboxylate transporter TctB family protein [Burkholderiaceae bacterium]
MRRADRVAGASLLAISVAFSAGALTNHVYWGEYGPGPGFLPFWLGVVMAGLATMLLVDALRSSDPGAPWLPSGDGLKRLAVVLGVTIAFVALLNVLGMIVDTALFLIVLIRYLDRSPWPLTLALSTATAAVIYLVFSFWLRVPFPVGPLGF